MAIDQLFDTNRSELDGGTINGNHRAQVHTLLLLPDQIPDNLTAKRLPRKLTKWALVSCFRPLPWRT
jgi:hypothetical protein